MRARAPGKVVLTGAYAVLEGAPAIVASVSRFALADSAFPGEGSTAELRAAFPRGDAPRVDLTAFHGPHGKLGLGGSAAALVAALMASTPREDRSRIFETARRIHREVQGGGSGIDVAASTFGGIQSFAFGQGGIADSPVVDTVRLPDGLVVRVYAVPQSARTSDLLGQVRAFAQAHASMYDACMDAVVAASHEAIDAAHQNDGLGFRDACARFAAALDRLGIEAGASIFLPAVRELGEVAARERSVFYPAGAGGGDLAVYVGLRDASPAFADLAAKHGIEALDVELGAPGVESV